MGLFFRHLVKCLDSSRPKWKSNTVVLIDNAPYHKSKGILNLLEELQVPVMYTGAHSYDAAPCELLFSAFKRADINPRHVKTGKK